MNHFSLSLPLAHCNCKSKDAIVAGIGGRVFILQILRRLF